MSETPKYSLCKSSITTPVSSENGSCSVRTVGPNKPFTYSNIENAHITCIGGNHVISKVKTYGISISCSFFPITAKRLVCTNIGISLRPKAV